jgi:lysophospholipase L1-like esterase
VLVDGDSLTRSRVASDPIVPATRHAAADRRPATPGGASGDGYEIVAAGPRGRTTNIDGPDDPKLSGADDLPAALASHEPLDLVVIMLATADATPEVLLVSPPPLAEETTTGGIFAGGRAKTIALAALYAAIAEAAGEHLFDAGGAVATDGVDGLHFTAATNATLGRAVADEVRAILAV